MEQNWSANEWEELRQTLEHRVRTTQGKQLHLAIEQQLPRDEAMGAREHCRRYLDQLIHILSSFSNNTQQQIVDMLNEVTDGDTIEGITVDGEPMPSVNDEEFEQMLQELRGLREELFGPRDTDDPEESVGDGTDRQTDRPEWSRLLPVAVGLLAVGGLAYWYCSD